MAETDIKIGIIGAGDGASSLIDILSGHPETRIAGLACRSENRPAVIEARKLGIPIYNNFRDLADSESIEILIDASGNPEVEDYLANNKKSKSQLLTRLGGWLMWNLVDEIKKKEQETARSLAEQEVLYSAGVMLASAADTKQTLDLIMESALSITSMSAGSLALYDEELGVMQIKASLGFNRSKLPEGYEWKLRAGGLTGHILSNSKPTVINDLDKDAQFDTSPLKEMGVRSLIAAPLKVSGKIVGILYVDDFNPHKFTDREVNILALLGLQAAAAIDKALLLEKAEIMATTDGLTKLYNHRFFVRALEREVKRAERYGASLALCMLDVDHFKAYNDTFGHLQGNLVLTNLSKIFKNSARETDVVARYGGEEFSIVFTETERESALEVAERIRHEVESQYFPGQERQPGQNLTVSLGMAVYPEDASTPVGLIENADRALYCSKQHGRNMVTDYKTMISNTDDKHNP